MSTLKITTILLWKWLKTDSEWNKSEVPV